MSQDQLRSDARELTHIKIRQLQQYLHRPGKIPTSIHPFAKQKLAQEAEHNKYLQRRSFLWRQVDRGWHLIGIITGPKWDAMKSWMNLSDNSEKS
jgi:hypothetical protein